MSRSCFRCGATPPHGYASMWTAATGNRWFCHPDEEWLPDCYSLQSYDETFPGLLRGLS